MKYFAEMLMLALVVSVLVLVYVVIQIAIILLTSAVSYVIIYLVGCMTPIAIYVTYKNRVVYQHSAFNTCQDNIMEMI